MGQNLELQLKQDIENAPENLIAEARKILNEDYTPSAAEIDRLRALKSLGFDNCKEVRKPDDIRKEKERIRVLMERANYYSKHYTYKFIDESAVKRICEKYGLFLATASDYTSDIPVKNQEEIIAFRVIDEDVRRPEEVLGEDMWRVGVGSLGSLFSVTTVPPPLNVGPPLNIDGLRFHNPFELDIERHRIMREALLSGQGRSGTAIRRTLYERIMDLPNTMPIPEGFEDKLSEDQMDSLRGMLESIKTGKKKTELIPGCHLLIMAPEDKLAKSSRRVKEGHIMKINDPIVLQPVREGYLIITAWGLEATDTDVQNPVTN